jgi:hypothetical protein
MHGSVRLQGSRCLNREGEHRKKNTLVVVVVVIVVQIVMRAGSGLRNTGARSLIAGSPSARARFAPRLVARRSAIKVHLFP